ncbi:hypothetical protein FV242_31365 [Methylobacterium sp. WL64]|uniref:hypothetical protein n=1 Tax=Methylobacterium sp. WL64 TaxID=2603894 RepID=UPI0011CC425D|nr:hypothetical protein [Methylobacterium sp. WL64]TXM97502.1 hypothetical protein FV242_31365 [Methylobacterium sp. WL64]
MSTQLIEASTDPEARRAVREGMRLYMIEAASWQQIAQALGTVPEGRMRIVHEISLAQGFCGAATLAGDEGALRRWRRGVAIHKGASEEQAREIA